MKARRLITSQSAIDLEQRPFAVLIRTGLRSSYWGAWRSLDGAEKVAAELRAKNFDATAVDRTKANA